MSRQTIPRHALPDYLPFDWVALQLEGKGLWRRAATRWQHLLLQATDNRQAEALVQRQQYCLRRVLSSPAPHSDGTAPAGVANAVSTGGSTEWARPVANRLTKHHDGGKEYDKTTRVDLG